MAKFAFWNRSEKQIFDLGEKFTAEYLPLVLRSTAMDRMNWHKAQGDKIVVVSASLKPYLYFWCKEYDVELICSELDSKNSLLTGRYVVGDCGGENKVAFIKNSIDLYSFDTIYAYGDTDEDLPMLGLAEIKYYQWSKMT